jgi:flavin-dependent dehydrogenase
VVRRRELDEMVAEQAVKAGATIWQGAEAVEPVVDGGLLAGAMVRDKDSGVVKPVRARYVVVADGANSRFGRALGTARDRSFPLGMAIRGYFTSPLHDEPWIESHLDIRDRPGPLGNLGRHGDVRSNRGTAADRRIGDSTRRADLRRRR